MMKKRASGQVKEKSSRFEEGKTVDVAKYLREHGNPEAAEEWEKYDGRVRELTAKALMRVARHHPEHRRHVASILKAAAEPLIHLFEDPKSTSPDWTGPLQEFLDDNEDALDDRDVGRIKALTPGKSVEVDMGAGGLFKVLRKK